MLSRAAVVAATLLLGSGMLAACERAPEDDATLIAFLAADARGRWADVDEPEFAGRVKRTCLGCDYLAADAVGDPEEQLEQAEEALDGGADVLVLHAVDRETGEEVVEAAGDVPVVAYDRYVPGADQFVSYDAATVGGLQGEYAARQAPPNGSVLLLSGPVTDDAQAERRRTLVATLRDAGVEIAGRARVAEPSAGAARRFVARRLEAPDPGLGDVLVAETDAQIAGALAAYQAAGTAPRRIPTMVGAGADVPAVRRLITGEQAATVALPAAEQARAAADLAVTYATGGEPEVRTAYEGVPAVRFPPVLVEVATLTETLVRSGRYTPEQICIPAVLPACERLGIR